MKKGDICVVDLFLGIGHEQNGKRPAIFFADTKTNIAIIIPLTSNIEALRFPYTLTIRPDKDNNLDEESVALIFHLRAVDNKRLSSPLGKINKQLIGKIDSILKKLLNL
ncbi:type II toxin-antitoxin system PemK/MazF family toxin [Candidatus Azambacteria bacterium]|nr:type II toxin-antitoxin system PemK/MazF family toxin [Candidatus Azambacteria bacterium]